MAITFKKLFGKSVCNHNIAGNVGDKDKLSLCSIKALIPLIQIEQKVDEDYILILESTDDSIKVPVHMIKDFYDFVESRRLAITTLMLKLEEASDNIKHAKNEGYKYNTVEVELAPIEALKEKLSMKKSDYKKAMQLLESYKKEIGSVIE